MKDTKWTVRIFAIAMMSILIGTVTGCGGGGGDDDILSDGSADNGGVDDKSEIVVNDFAGVWLIQKGDSSSYWIFNEDGTFEKKRSGEPLDSRNHFSGTYIITEGYLTGEFTNPGVGNGAIQGLIAEDGTFQMDFIEYWYPTPKVVACVGVRQQ